MLNRLFALIVSCSLLSACMAVMVAGAAVSMIVYDSRSVSTLESDARIFHTIHTRIVKDPHFSDSRINVVSFNRVVLLVGQTSTEALRDLALQIAREAPAVIRVYNELRVGHPLRFSTRTKDTLISGELRAHMLKTKGLESGSIRIVVEAGVVYLMGIVTPEQADLVVNVARHTKGVRKVFKAFQYIR